MFMKKIYFLLFPLFLYSCSTTIQYVGRSYKPGKDPEIFVDESEIIKPYSIIARGYLNTGIYSRGINWNRVQREAIKKGSKHGADAVLIVQKNTMTPLPAFQTYSRTDSIGRGIKTYSHSEPYYPVSTWNDILFLKYK